MKCWTTSFQKRRMSTEYFCERQQIEKSVTLALFGCLGNYLGSPSFSSSHEREVSEAIFLLASHGFLLHCRAWLAVQAWAVWKCRQAHQLAFETQLLWAQFFGAVSAATSGCWASPAQHLRPSPWPTQGTLISVRVLVGIKAPLEEDLFSINLLTFN